MLMRLILNDVAIIIKFDFGKLLDLCLIRFFFSPLFDRNRISQVEDNKFSWERENPKFHAIKRTSRFYK